MRDQPSPPSPLLACAINPHPLAPSPVRGRGGRRERKLLPFLPRTGERGWGIGGCLRVEKEKKLEDRGLLHLKKEGLGDRGLLARRKGKEVGG